LHEDDLKDRIKNWLHSRDGVVFSIKEKVEILLLETKEL